MKPTDEQAAAADAFHAGDHLRPAGRRRHREDHHPRPPRPHHHPPRPLPRLQPGHRPGRRHPLPDHRPVQDRPRPCLRGHRPPLHPPPERTPPPGLADRPGPRHHQAIRIAERDITQRPSPTPCCAPWPASATPPTQPSPATTCRACAAWRPTICTPNSPTIVPFARKAWADLHNPDDGAVRFDHDHYLKMWALTQPRIDADFLLLDEAQDTNPVVEHIFLGHRDHAQLVMVGDSAQAIYDWRGASDVMTGFDGTQLTLSQSFRFGPHLAEEANRWLALADAPLRLTGTETVPTELGPLTRPDAVLCRTNVGAMSDVMQPDDRRMPGGAGRGRRQPARPGTRRPRPEGRPPHHPPRTSPVPLLGRTAGLRRPRPGRPRPAAPCRPRRHARHRRHPHRRRPTRPRAARRGDRLDRPQG